MGIFSKVEDAAKSIKDDYEKAIARGKEVEAEAKADVVAAETSVKNVAQRVEEVFETLAKQALNEVERFTQAAEDALEALLKYEERLKADIADKSAALTKVQETIGKVRAVAPAVATSNTSEGEPAATVGTAPDAQAT